MQRRGNVFLIDSGGVLAQPRAAGGHADSVRNLMYVAVQRMEPRKEEMTMSCYYDKGSKDHGKL